MPFWNLWYHQRLLGLILAPYIVIYEKYLIPLCPTSYNSDIEFLPLIGVTLSGSWGSNSALYLYGILPFQSAFTDIILLNFTTTLGWSYCYTIFVARENQWSMRLTYTPRDIQVMEKLKVEQWESNFKWTFHGIQESRGIYSNKTPIGEQREGGEVS